MTLNSYIAGSLVTVSVTFIDEVTQLPANPNTVTLSTSVNNGGAVVYTYGGGVIVNDSVGVYHAELDTTAQPGAWWYVWEGTGTVQAINAQGFTVTKPPV